MRTAIAPGFTSPIDGEVPTSTTSLHVVARGHAITDEDDVVPVSFVQYTPASSTATPRGPRIGYAVGVAFTTFCGRPPPVDTRKTPYASTFSDT